MASNIPAALPWEEKYDNDDHSPGYLETEDYADTRAVLMVSVLVDGYYSSVLYRLSLPISSCRHTYTLRNDRSLSLAGLHHPLHSYSSLSLIGPDACLHVITTPTEEHPNGLFTR